MPQFNWKLFACALALIVIVAIGDMALIIAQEDAAKKAAQADAAAEVEADEESPLLTEPKTPEETFDAVITMTQLGRDGLAKKYLEQLIESKPSDDVILKLRDTHGPAIFLKLANNKKLHPLSSQLLTRINRLISQHANDPRRIDALIADLSGTPGQREIALISLKNTGPVVVPRIILQIADPKKASQLDDLAITLRELGPAMIPPLLAAIDSPNEAVRLTSINTLGHIGSRKIAASLWHPAFAKSQPNGIRLAARRALARLYDVSVEKMDGVTSYGVAGELRKISLQHLRYEYAWKQEQDADSNGLVVFWSWHPESGTVAVAHLSPEEASLRMGMKLSQQAVELAPESRDIHTTFLCLLLGHAAHQAGWGKPLPTGPGTAHDLALVSGRARLSDSLRLALEHSNPNAAMASLQILAQVGTKHQLYKRASKQSPIVSALNYPDPRVQFAAAGTILQLDPDLPFRGASRVVSILTQALSDSGTPHCVVVNISSQKAATIAGFLGRLGYDPLIAQTGRDGFRIAAERTDVELIVLQLNTIRWNLSPTVANLRADARTAHIPIAVYGPESRKHRVVGLLGRYPLITYVNKSSTSEHFDIQLRPFLDRLRTPPLSSQERRTRSAAAVNWLAHIASGRRIKVFNIVPAEEALSRTAHDPEFGESAVFALGAIPTRTVQGRLQEIALNSTLDANLRKSATLQLAFHIQRFGLLLTDKQVSEIKLAWKGTNDPQLATALASLVGSLKPNAKRVGDRFRSFTLPRVQNRQK